MRRVPTYLENCQSVVDAFGYWPAFHDSPVLRFHVEAQTIVLEVEAWEMSSEVDDRGYFILSKRHRIGFRFSEIVSTHLSEFLPENILFGLCFSPDEDYREQGCFTVDLDSALGSDLCGSVSAKEGKVTFVHPATTSS